MVTAIIDVWDVATFDDELRADLDAHPEMILDFFLTSRRLWLEREATDHTKPYPENPHAGAFQWVTEHIMRLMEKRTIRAWHYTRMSDAEVDALRAGGIYPSTPENIRARFAAQVAAGAFTAKVADRLYADSPYQSDQLDSRSNKFWMVSHPVDIEDGGVELLLESWGGESAYFWQRDLGLQALLKGIGTPRVLEIAVPLCHSRHRSISSPVSSLADPAVVAGQSTAEIVGGARVTRRVGSTPAPTTASSRPIVLRPGC